MSHTQVKLVEIRDEDLGWTGTGSVWTEAIIVPREGDSTRNDSAFVPNEATEEAINEAREGGGKSFATMQELFEDLLE